MSVDDYSRPKSKGCCYPIPLMNTGSARSSKESVRLSSGSTVLNLVKKYEAPDRVCDTRDCLPTFFLSEDDLLARAGDAIK